MEARSDTCNGLQVTGLAYIQDEPWAEEKSKFPQEDSFEVAEIVRQSWLTEQAQPTKFHRFLRDGLTNIVKQLIEGITEKHETDRRKL